MSLERRIEKLELNHRRAFRARPTPMIVDEGVLAEAARVLLTEVEETPWDRVTVQDKHRVVEQLAATPFGGRPIQFDHGKVLRLLEVA